MHLLATLSVVALPLTLISSVRFATYASHDITLRHGQPLARHRRWPKIWIAAQRWFTWLRWCRIILVASARFVPWLAAAAHAGFHALLATVSRWAAWTQAGIQRVWTWLRTWR